MNFKVYKNTYAVYRLDRNENIPQWIDVNDFCSITNTEDELSIVCRFNENLKEDIRCEKDFRLIKINEVLDFSLVGILSEITTILSKNNISVFAVSTYNTDYILVKNKDLDKTIELLSENNNSITIE